MVVITHKHIEHARAHGACQDGLRAVQVGTHVSDLPRNALVWLEGTSLVSLADINEMSSPTTIVIGMIPLRLLSEGGKGYELGSGYGCGNGDEYGGSFGPETEYGFGFGYGFGHGFKDEADFGYGDGYGAGAGDSFGFGLGLGFGYGDGYGDGAVADFGYGDGAGYGAGD